MQSLDGRQARMHSPGFPPRRITSLKPSQQALLGLYSALRAKGPSQVSPGQRPGSPATNEMPVVFRSLWALSAIPFHGIAGSAQGFLDARLTQPAGLG